MCVRPPKKIPVEMQASAYPPNVTTAIGLGGVMRLGGIFTPFFDMISVWIHITAGFGSCLSGHRWRAMPSASKAA